MIFITYTWKAMCWVEIRIQVLQDRREQENRLNFQIPERGDKPNRDAREGRDVVRPRAAGFARFLLDVAIP